MDELKPDHITALRAYLERGGSLREVARRSGVSRETIRSWLRRGPPMAIEHWFKVMEAIQANGS